MVMGKGRIVIHLRAPSFLPPQTVKGGISHLSRTAGKYQPAMDDFADSRSVTVFHPSPWGRESIHRHGVESSWKAPFPLTSQCAAGGSERDVEVGRQCQKLRTMYARAKALAEAVCLPLNEPPKYDFPSSICSPRLAED